MCYAGMDAVLAHHAQLNAYERTGNAQFLKDAQNIPGAVNTGGTASTASSAITMKEGPSALPIQAATTVGPTIPVNRSASASGADASTPTVKSLLGQ
jgi:hypothetical protein